MIESSTQSKCFHSRDGQIDSSKGKLNQAGGRGGGRRETERQREETEGRETVHSHRVMHIHKHTHIHAEKCIELNFTHTYPCDKSNHYPFLTIEEEN